MKRLWFYTVRCLITLSLVQGILLVLSIPGAAPSSADVGYELCHSPCWHAIQPGKMTLAEVQSLLRRDSTVYNIAVLDNNLCWMVDNWQGCADTNEPRQIVNEITFTPPADTFQLGDAIQLYGTPLASADACLLDDDGNFETTASVLFDHQIEVSVSAPTSNFMLSPFMVVMTVIYSARSPLVQRSSSWRGFTFLNDSAGDCE